MATYALIGDPVGRSLSPAMHNAAFRELGMDSAYIAYRVPPGGLGEAVPALREARIAGYNVTIPHKVGIMEHLDRTDEACSLIGAANTVSDTEGTMRGYNTDMDGFLEPLLSRGLDLGGTSALVVGTGGAARAAVAGLAKEGAGRITISSRSAQNGRDMARFAGRLGQEAEAAGPMPDVSGHDLVVNATPAGAGGGPPAVKTGGLTSGMTVYDMVYSPARTQLLRAARGAGAEPVYGHEMLLAQAVRSFQIWHGRDDARAHMKKALVGP